MNNGSKDYIVKVITCGKHFWFTELLTAVIVFTACCTAAPQLEK